MMQLMTDALGDDGPALLRDIFADPQRATLFRQAFSGYLEEVCFRYSFLFTPFIF
jgi:hypothetical protein